MSANLFPSKKLTPQQVGLLSAAVPSPFGDALGLLADTAGYIQDPSSLTPGRGLLSLAALIPGIPRGLKFDPRKGLGAVPWNQEVAYRGFEREMPVSEFLRLASDLKAPKPDSLAYIKNHISSGRPVGNPFLEVEFRNGKFDVVGHEGRHRAKAISDLFGQDAKMPVHVFPKGMRKKDLTADMLNAELVPEDKVIHAARTAEIERLSKEVQSLLGNK